MADKFVAQVHQEDVHRIIGRPLLATTQSPSNVKMYIIASLIVKFASLGFQSFSSLLNIGGGLQNPILVLFNFFSPDQYNKFKLSSSIKATVYALSGILMAG
jgi:hypothetical protein